jgi:flagellar protein FlaG
MEIRTDHAQKIVNTVNAVERVQKSPENLDVRDQVNANVNQKQEEPTKQPVEEMIQDLEGSLEKMKGLLRSNLQFEINKEAERVVVTVVNKDNGEVIRQIPPEGVVKLLQNLNELIGALMDERA